MNDIIINFVFLDMKICIVKLYYIANKPMFYQSILASSGLMCPQIVLNYIGNTKIFGIFIYLNNFEQDLKRSIIKSMVLLLVLILSMYKAEKK